MYHSCKRCDKAHYETLVDCTNDICSEWLMSKLIIKHLGMESYEIKNGKGHFL